MKIVVLDGYAENPGDLSWGALEALGELTVYNLCLPDARDGLRLPAAAGAVVDRQLPQRLQRQIGRAHV